MNRKFLSWTAATLVTAAAVLPASWAAGTHAGETICNFGSVNRNVVHLSDGNDNESYGSGHQCVDAKQGNDNVDTNGGSDGLLGGTGSDVLRSGAGNDWIDGEGGDDTLRGEGGDDILQGRDGDDRIYDGPGGDTVEFGSGTDDIWFHCHDGSNDVVTQAPDDHRHDGSQYC